jgi:hypothetical protein
MRGELRRIHQHQHGVQSHAGFKPGKLGDTPGVGDAAGLHHDPLRRRIFVQQPGQAFPEIGAEGATDAAIGQPRQNRSPARRHGKLRGATDGLPPLFFPPREIRPER